MKAEDIRKLPWRTVKDWERLPFSITKRDIEIMVSDVYLKFFRVLNISEEDYESHELIEDIKIMLDTENEPFYTLKDEKLSDHHCYEKNEDIIIQLKDLFRMPSINMLENKLEECLELYKQLSDIEKIQFLKETGDIKIECHITSTKMVD